MFVLVTFPFGNISIIGNRRNNTNETCSCTEQSWCTGEYCILYRSTLSHNRPCLLKSGYSVYRTCPWILSEDPPRSNWVIFSKVHQVPRPGFSVRSL
ncbi:hypothetical protein CEXT_760871 [Caerostris extrusa]|uniref:Secreted protein n=1 Tax=Caerostris extrusa TaxID=172846 RepID=A0AAV4XII9_CAEEX|nr:hypothetical protein CEXT_760871 [Caerostris extrusa]